MLLRSLKRPRRRCRILRGDAGTSVAGRRTHGVAHRPTQAPRPGSPGIVPYKHRDAPQVNRLREAIRVGRARPGSTIQMTTEGSASMSCLRAGVGLASSRIAARPGTAAAVGRDSAGTLPQPHVRPPVPPAGCLPARSCPQASAIAGRHAVTLSQPEALWISRRGMAAIQLRWNGSVGRLQMRKAPVKFSARGVGRCATGRFGDVASPRHRSPPRGRSHMSPCNVP